MTGIFKANHPSNNFILIVYAFLLKLPMFLYPETPEIQEFDGFLFRKLLNALSATGHSYPLIYPVITFIFLVSQALILNRVVNNQKLMQKQSFMPAMSYVLLTSLFSEWYNFSACLLINSIMIWVFSQLCKLHNHPQPKSILFNIGIATGINAFLYFPSLTFIILVFAGLSYTRPFRIHEWLVMILGVLTPFYFAAAWFYYTDRWSEAALPFVKVTLPLLRETQWVYVGILLVAIAVLVGVFFIQANLRRQLVQVRKSWALVFLYLLVAVFVPFVNASSRFDYWILAAVPISIILSAAFLYPERKWFPATIHWGIVAIIITIEYFIR